MWEEGLPHQPKGITQRVSYEEVSTAKRTPIGVYRHSRSTTITFDKKDEESILHPDDFLVVTMKIANFMTRKVLVNKGSSADILF